MTTDDYLYDPQSSGWARFADAHLEAEETEYAAHKTIQRQVEDAKDGVLPEDYDPLADDYHPALTPDQRFAAREAAAAAKRSKP